MNLVLLMEVKIIKRKEKRIDIKKKKIKIFILMKKY